MNGVQMRNISLQMSYHKKKIAPFLISVISIRIRVDIAKSQIFRRLWYSQLFIVWYRSNCR